MDINNVRVRFAPSPTGFMHLGNVRAALINFLFAQQKQGTFILRIEDTDQQRNTDPAGIQIMADLEWLNLHYTEGPVKGGPYAPYYQSERQDIYQEHLDTLKKSNLVYRCFCTVEELDKKRQRQLALKNPPRYDRACMQLSQQKIAELLDAATPFIWRFKLDYDKPVEFYDLAHKTMHFDLSHFSDIPLTRQDGSFTFMFANFVDDMVMKITHVFRGEDHLTNTAAQTALYRAFNAPLPLFYHLPIIGNQEGKKLSKRDFGFSLNDLRDAGYLPEALCNYLGIIGRSFEHEIMTLEQLATAFRFDDLSSTGQIRYDLEKLRWVNHQWIMHYNTEKLVTLCRPYLEEAYPQISDLSQEKLTELIKHSQQEIVTLKESVSVLEFYFTIPRVPRELLEYYHFSNHKFLVHKLVPVLIDSLDKPDEAVKAAQALCKQEKAPIKDIFTILRLALTGKPQGPGIKDLLVLLPIEQSKARLSLLLA
jgi:nondiscriminating glutamyl-tRNA synthetase